MIAYIHIDCMLTLVDKHVEHVNSDDDSALYVEQFDVPADIPFDIPFFKLNITKTLGHRW